MLKDGNNKHEEVCQQGGMKTSWMLELIPKAHSIINK